MCRHLAYLGPPRPLREVVLSPPLGLVRQSYLPGDMRGAGNVNADGFGVGWYPGPGAEPVRYRSGRPIWADESFAQLAGITSSGAVLAAVRSATEGMPVVHTACAPFTGGGWLFSHNGFISGWPGSIAPLAAELPVTDLLTLEAATDSALLWALVRHRLRAGAGGGEALAAVVAQVAAAAPGSRLNLLLTDGAVVYATTWGHALHTHSGNGEFTVASEPLDERQGWTEVAPGYLITGTATTGARGRPIAPAESTQPDQHQPGQHQPDQHQPDQHQPDQHRAQRQGVR